MGCTNSVSDNEDWDSELFRAERGKLFNRTDGPPIRSVTEEVVIRIYPQKMYPLYAPKTPDGSDLIGEVLVKRIDISEQWETHT